MLVWGKISPEQAEFRALLPGLEWVKETDTSLCVVSIFTVEYTLRLLWECMILWGKTPLGLQQQEKGGGGGIQRGNETLGGMGTALPPSRAQTSFVKQARAVGKAVFLLPDAIL